MSIYKELSDLLPYLQSIRVIKGYLTFDMVFPEDWKYPKKFVEEDKFMEQTSPKDGHRMFSFVSEMSDENVTKNSENIVNIIKYNLEREMKNKLFETKVNELKDIFEKQNLQKLQNLNFNFKKNKIELEDETRDNGEAIEMVG